MKQRFDIVVVGAGITGLMVAALLAQCNRRDRLRLMLLDAAPRPFHSPADDVDLRVSAIAWGSAALIDSIGAWRYVQETRACGYDRMRVWDSSAPLDGAATLRFDAADFGVPQLGFIVENALLQHALLDILVDAPIELSFSTPIRSLTRDANACRLELDGADGLSADLVIGADGAGSIVRESIGIETRDWRYGQTAFVTHVEPEHSHRNTAWQRFLRDGPLGMLPLADGRISVVWSTTAAQAEWAMAASDEELGRALTEVSDAVLGNLRIAGPRGTFPLIARHAEHYVQRGVALIGDAAHAVHPLAGQGANLGIQDAAELAAVIGTAVEHGEHPGDRPVLRRYERARKGANATMLHFLTGLNRLFATDSALIRELRTIGMTLFNKSGPLREHMVGIALAARR